MKAKSISILIIALVLSSFQNTIAQSTTEKRDTAISLDSTKTIYTCSMHPEIVSDKPGNCAKCGMELVKLEKGKKQSESMQHQMGMMMCPMHGMVDMNHKHDEPKKDNMKMMKWMGMGIMMAAMMVVMLIAVSTN